MNTRAGGKVAEVFNLTGDEGVKNSKLNMVEKLEENSSGKRQRNDESDEEYGSSHLARRLLTTSIKTSPIHNTSPNKYLRGQNNLISSLKSNGLINIDEDTETEEEQSDSDDN